MRSKSLRNNSNVRASSAFSAKGHGSSAGGGGAGGDDDGKGGAGVNPGEEEEKTVSFFLSLSLFSLQLFPCLTPSLPFLFGALLPFSFPHHSNKKNKKIRKNQEPGTFPPPAAATSLARSSSPTRPLTSPGSC